MLFALLAVSALAGTPTAVDPAVATVLSAHVGFGAGHFYARRPVAGLTWFTIEMGGLGMTAYGVYNIIEGTGTNFDVKSPKLPEYVDQIETWDWTPTVKYTPHDQMQINTGLLLTTVGISTYCTGRLLDTLLAPRSAKKHNHSIWLKR